jgi:hypothetical protein
MGRDNAQNLSFACKRRRQLKAFAPIGERGFRPFGQLGHDLEEVLLVCRIVHDVDAARLVSEKFHQHVEVRFDEIVLDGEEQELGGAYAISDQFSDSCSRRRSTYPNRLLHHTGRTRRITGSKTSGPGIRKFYGAIDNRMGHNPNGRYGAC